MVSPSTVLRQCAAVVRACINDVHKLAHEPKYLNNRDERSRFASYINTRLEGVFRALEGAAGAVENLEHKR